MSGRSSIGTNNAGIEAQTTQHDGIIQDVGDQGDHMVDQRTQDTGFAAQLAQQLLQLG